MYPSMKWITGLILAAYFSPVMAAGTYEAEVRTTSYGISHIKADDWGSLGLGYGYVYAGHNLCILAREVVEANGRQALYFGETTSRVEQDLFYTLVNNDSFVDEFLASVSAQGRELVRGYAAGYNRYLRDTGSAALPAACRDASWVREIDERDMLKVFYKLILRASAGALVSLINDATPPAVATRAMDLPRLRQRVGKADFSTVNGLLNRDDLGSNMYALGANATRSGRGIVLGNPHFPWNGPLRWYQIHLTIPGQLDVMGASLQGVPLVNIGFNEHVAWSHTVSPAARFTLFELSLVPGNPLQYWYDGVATDLEVHPVSIEVTTAGGMVETREHTFYRSKHGWVLDFGGAIGIPLWTPTSAFALGDANAQNLRAIEQFLLMNQAGSLAEFVDILKTNVGLPWVHTVAGDAHGNAFYGDISVVPNVSQAKLDACPGPALGGFLAGATGLAVLDGSSSACRWDNDADAPQPGIIGAANLPALQTRDYVSNSNDNHWLSNPDMPLEGFSPMFGPERTQRSLRTRLGLLQVAQRLDGSDGAGAPGYTLHSVQDALFGSRNYLGELIADQLATLCVEEGPDVFVDGMTVDVSGACDVLAGWDKRQRVDSVGAQVLLEFVESVFAADNDPLLVALFAEPFDVDNPVTTPSGLADTDPADRQRWMEELGRAVRRLADNGIALDAPWGDIQFEEKGGVRYPIHGGRDGSGMFSIITANLSAGLGYTPVRHGNSYMQTVTWDEGGVVADALLSYSQSSDPASPNYSDQTALYSAATWVRLPFTDAEIEADPAFSSFVLTEPRDTDDDGVFDDVDNCTGVANPDQRDTDGDGFGNFCDPDLNQDLFVNFLDLAALRSVFSSADPDADFNGDGTVDFADLAIMKDGFFAAPGPSCAVPGER